MTIFLTAFFSSIVSGCFALCITAALMASGRESRDEESGAPEGMLPIKNPGAALPPG